MIVPGQGGSGLALTAKFFVIICRVHSKMASNTRGTSGAMSSRNLVMMAANRLSTSASLHAIMSSGLPRCCASKSASLYSRRHGLS